NWNSLVTRDDGYYEPGVFDVRGPQPRPTLLARAVQSLATTGQFDHPVLDQPGWWRRPERLWYPVRQAGGPASSSASQLEPSACSPARAPRQLLIMGGPGPRGRSF